jgi:2-polyprenyl-3-methyl-5-hydroxy-6-metoxy-1,4-benzoquinol methylase
MSDLELKAAHEETRDAWNANAAYWDEQMGEGNDFVNVLIWPPTQRLLALQPGERVLEIACGNGLYARKLATLGVNVVATDFAPEMIARAQARSSLAAGKIEYRVLDATDEAAFLALGERAIGERPFDAAICMMGLMDMSEISPLMRALARLLRPGGRFVFAIMHPCFNSVHVTLMGEQEDRKGNIVTTYSVKISGYMTPSVARGAALRGQPVPHVYFHRPLQAVLGAGFAAGFVLDGLQERAFPPDHPPGRNAISWGPNFSEIPPVLIARMRLPEGTRNPAG